MKNYGRAHSLRLAGRHGHAGLLRSGGSKPLVHFGLRGSVRPRLDLRFPAGRMAIRDHRSYMGWRSDVALVAEVTDLIADSTITCPKCGHRASEQMPTHACRFFYDCNACGERLEPLPGDCCVFCSYGSVPCPPIQAGRSCQNTGDFESGNGRTARPVSRRRRVLVASGALIRPVSRLRRYNSRSAA
jgi:hypothetical protein